MPYRRYIRRMTMSDIMDLSVGLMRERFRQFVGLWLWCNIPVVISLAGIGTGAMLVDEATGATGRSVAGAVLIALSSFAALWGVWRAVKYSPAVIRLVAGTIMGQPETAREAYRGVPAILVLHVILLGVILIVVLGIVLVVPSVLAVALLPRGAVAGVVILAVAGTLTLPATIWWMMAVIVLVLDGHTAFSAYIRSWKLLRGFYWRPVVIAAAVFMVTQAVQAGVYGVMMAAFALVQTAGEDGALLMTAITVAGGVIPYVTVVPIVTSAMSAALVLVHYDMRVRKEGMDLHMAVREARKEEARGPAASASAGPTLAVQ